jgi:hypothetical protein
MKRPASQRPAARTLAAPPGALPSSAGHGARQAHSRVSLEAPTGWALTSKEPAILCIACQSCTCTVEFRQL